MTVYVDDDKTPIGGALCCNMFADSLAELHAMAKAINLGRFAFREGTALAHYDVCMTKRAKAIKLGAVEVDAEWRRARIRDALEKRSA